MTGGTPPRGAHPRVLLAAAAQTLGEEEVVTWCARLLRGEDRPDDPDLAWLGGTDDWLPYWRRVWGARGLLYVWSDEALKAVAAGLSDPHWRVREAALRVVRARGLDALVEEVAALLDDPNDRIRTAAERALHHLA